MHKLDDFMNTIESLPTVTPESLFLLEDVAGKVLKGHPIEGDIDMLRLIFVEIQGQDRGIVSFLQSMQNGGAITTDEMLITSLYFLVSAQIGPESSTLRQMVYCLDTDQEVFNSTILSIKMPENIRQVIVSVYNKMKK